MADDTGPWVLALAAIPGIGTAIVALYNARNARKSGEDDAEERARIKIETDKADVLKMYRDEAKRLGAEVDDERQEKNKARRDADRGWWLARWWNGNSASGKLGYQSALQAANARLEHAGLPVVADPFPEELPSLETPAPGWNRSAPK